MQIVKAFSGTASPDDFFRIYAICQAVGFLFSFIGLAYELPPRKSGDLAFFSALLAPYVVANGPFMLAAIRRSRDSGTWAIFLILPGLLALPCFVFALTGLAAIIAPSHPWYFWHAILGLFLTGVVSLLAVAVLGSRPSKITASANTPPSEVIP